MAKNSAASLLAIGLFLIMIFPVSYASVAVTTELAISAKPYHDLSILITNADTGAAVQKFSKNLNSSGEIKFNIISFAVKDVSIEAVLLKEGSEILRKTYGPYSVKSPISLNLNAELTEPETEKNETPKTEEIKANNTQEQNQNSGISGKAVEGSITDKLPVKIILIVIGAVVLGLIIFFVVKYLKKRKIFSGNIDQENMGGQIMVKKQSDYIKKQKDATQSSANPHLAAMEDKIKELQTELSKIKNKEKIEAARRRLEEDKRILDRLSKGEDI